MKSFERNRNYDATKEEPKVLQNQATPKKGEKSLGVSFSSSQTEAAS